MSYWNNAIHHPPPLRVCRIKGIDGSLNIECWESLPVQVAVAEIKEMNRRRIPVYYVSIGYMDEKLRWYDENRSPFSSLRLITHWRYLPPLPEITDQEPMITHLLVKPPFFE